MTARRLTIGRPARETPVFVVDPWSGIVHRQLWAAVLEDLRSQYPGVWATWLRPTSLVGLDGARARHRCAQLVRSLWLVDTCGLRSRSCHEPSQGGTRSVSFEVEQEWLARQTER